MDVAVFVVIVLVGYIMGVVASTTFDVLFGDRR